MGVPADPAELERLAAAGVDRVLFWLPSGRLAVVEARLDAVERAMDALTGGAL